MTRARLTILLFAFLSSLACARRGEVPGTEGIDSEGNCTWVTIGTYLKITDQYSAYVTTKSTQALGGLKDQCDRLENLLGTSSCQMADLKTKAPMTISVAAVAPACGVANPPPAPPPPPAPKPGKGRRQQETEPQQSTPVNTTQGESLTPGQTFVFLPKVENFVTSDYSLVSNGEVKPTRSEGTKASSGGLSCTLFSGVKMGTSSRRRVLVRDVREKTFRASNADESFVLRCSSPEATTWSLETLKGIFKNLVDFQPL